MEAIKAEQTIFSPSTDGMGRSVFLLEFYKDGVLDGNKRFYGSLTALYEKHKPEEIGTSIHTIYRRVDEDWKTPYDNKIVRITKGELISAEPKKAK